MRVEGKCAGLVAIMGLVLLLATACDESNSFETVDTVELSVSPVELAFPGVTLGEQATRSIVLENKSSTVALVNITLEETITREDALKEFSWPEELAAQLAEQIELPPLGRVELPVIYTPQNSTSDTGAVLIAFNNPGKSPLRVTLSTADANPDMDAPGRVLFGRVPSGGSAQKNVTLQNVGSSPLRIDGIVLEPEAEFTLCYPDSPSATNCPEQAFPTTLSPEETLEMRVNYNPIDDGEDLATVRITSNDPDESTFTINLNANGSQPCISVDGEGGYDFGTGFIGGVSRRTLNIRNCSPNKELIIDNIELAANSDAAFGLENLPGTLPDDSTIIGVDDEASFVLSYAPSVEEEHEASIEIRSNDEAKNPLIIPVKGVGGTNACPIAQAKAREVGTANDWDDTIETIPLAVLQLDGEDSTDPDAQGDPEAISAYEWIIVDRPVNSTAEFMPNNTEPSPQIFLDLAGTYIVELRVFDQQGTPSCSSSRITILATPDEDIHMQLVWDTPGDTDQTDSGLRKGADLDLHFLHPRGNWNSNPWDCYWTNRVPNWSTSSGIDDPSLDIDDTDGSGPENINLNNPEIVDYRLGVYYFSDHGFGPSYATVRIYLSQVLVYEYKDKYLERTGKFWDVAEISWSETPRVNQRDQLYDGFP